MMKQQTKPADCTRFDCTVSCTVQKNHKQHRSKQGLFFMLDFFFTLSVKILTQDHLSTFLIFIQQSTESKNTCKNM